MLFAFAGLTLILLASAQRQRVVVDVYPRVVMAGGAVRLIARVARHPDNRLLRISLDCERFYTASEIELEGVNAPITHQLPLVEGLPPGACVALAQLGVAGGGVINSTPVELVVAGGDPDAR